MRERKYIKIKVDMFEDTKFKIIDSREDRDTIHYIWTRILALCGKVNNEDGYLFISKNIPYTTEILALEFNRTVEQIETAINVFIELNMIARDKSINAFKICNWAKHQGIKKNEIEKKNEIDIEEVNNEEKLDLKNSENEVGRKDEKKVIKMNKSNKENEINLNSNISEISKNRSKNKESSKRRKSKIRKDVILESDDDMKYVELCGFDIPEEIRGTLIKQFDFTNS